MIEVSFKVGVRCMTFNQAFYIEDAMNGFCMQQTNFPFVCCIMDDASTDGEPDVIRKYLQANFELDDKSVVRNEETNDYTMTFARHKENRNCYFAVYLLRYNHYGKKNKLPYIAEWINHAEYSALCEGDDYWTDSSKLQRQADALDAHPECTIAFNRVQIVDSAKNSLHRTIPPKGSLQREGIVTIEDLMREEFWGGKWTFQTCSFFFRCVITTKYLELKKTVFKNYPYGDMPVVLTALLNGNGYLLPDTMSCYRWMSGGYNSYMISHIDKAIHNQEKIKVALSDLDEYTGGKYHRYIKRHQLWCDLHIANMYFVHSGKKINFALLRPKFWPLLKFSNFYGWTVQLIKVVMPQIYLYLMKIKSGSKK